MSILEGASYLQVWFRNDDILFRRILYYDHLWGMEILFIEEDVF